MARSFTEQRPVPQTRFTTSDGRRFDTPAEANSHQLSLDFNLWYSDPENQLMGNPNNPNNVLEWLTLHKTDIQKILT